jgi:hypothetical protein
MFSPLFNFPFLFITKMSQAQQAAEDMINQTIAKMSFGEGEKENSDEKIFKELFALRKYEKVNWKLSS